MARSGVGPIESVSSNDQIIAEYLTIMRKNMQRSIDQTIVERIILNTSALPRLVCDASTTSDFKSKLTNKLMYSAFKIGLDDIVAGTYSAHIADIIVKNIRRPKGMYKHKCP